MIKTCKDKIKIVLIPLDNRPVSYLLPQNIAELNTNIELLLPPREITGGLYEFADINKIFLWLEETITNERIDFIVCSLDTVAYGGLIPSRRSEESEQEVKSRIKQFKNLINKSNHKLKIYAFSSIMRISNNNINEEEKEYWNEYGELLFQYSYLLNKLSSLPSFDDAEKLKEIKKKIPQKIIEDYFSTRRRNFNINKYYLELLNEGFFHFLAFSQDDTSKFGLNVEEAGFLRNLISENNLSSTCCVKTGADEIPSDLLTRGIVEHSHQKIKIFPVFSLEEGQNIVSRYEDVTIYDSTIGQIELCGGELAVSEDEADILIIVHTPKEQQNDYAMKLFCETENIAQIEKCMYLINICTKPVIIADVACANGADNMLVQKILANGIDLNKIYGYAGWNTTGNTLGSVVSTGMARFVAEKQGLFDMEKFKKALFVRLADDWAYQSIARQKIRAFSEYADETILNQEIAPYLFNIAKKLDLKVSTIKCSFPWNRTFEVEIDFKK